MIYNLFLCLGDSLTFGARDRYGRNYPLELAQRMSEKSGEEWYCITEAYNGRVSSELAREAYQVVSKYPDAYGVLLLIGTNDSRGGVPAEIYEDNIRQIVRVCRVLKKKVYALSIPTIAVQRHFLWFDEASLRRIDEYNRILQEMDHVRFIDIRDVIGEEELIDGVHFTHEANVKLAEFLAARLLSLPSSVTASLEEPVRW